MATDRSKLQVGNGTPLDQASSALIKSIRQGLELDAAGWLVLIADRYPHLSWRLLAQVAVEDVGIGDPQGITVVQSCRGAWEAHRAGSSGPAPSLYMIMAGMYLARASKSREADSLWVTARNLLDGGWQPLMPEGTIDGHTAEGRASATRDDLYRQYLEVGTVLHPDEGDRDWWLWIRRRAARTGHLDPQRVEEQAKDWEAEGRLRHGPDGYGSVREGAGL